MSTERRIIQPKKTIAAISAGAKNAPFFLSACTENSFTVKHENAEAMSDSHKNMIMLVLSPPTAIKTAREEIKVEKKVRSDEKIIRRLSLILSPKPNRMRVIRHTAEIKRSEPEKPKNTG